MFLLSFLVASNIYAQKKPIKVGLLLADLNIERWSKDKDYFLSTAQYFNFDIVYSNAHNDQKTQNYQADSMIKAGAKLLVVVPVDGYLAASIVENAHKYNVKVIAYDRLIMNCDLDAYVSYDNEIIGTVMALYTTIRVNRGNVVYIGGPKSDMNSLPIRKGLMRELKKHNQLKVVCDTFVKNWASDESKKIITEFLSKNDCPEIIYTASDELAEGVIEVLEQKGLAGKVVVTGQDADLRAIRDLISGKQTLTIFKPIRLLADRAAQLGAGLLEMQPFLTITNVNNGKVDVPSLILFPIPVDKNNIDATVLREGYYSENEIYGSK